jgi:hypothetical protein
MARSGGKASRDDSVRDHVRQATVTQLNAEIRALGHRFLPFDSFDWGFWCECGAESCHEHVMLPLLRFDELRRLGDPLLAEGHPVERARELRRQARELREESTALKAQATHQSRRARRLGGRDVGGSWT